MLAVTAGGLLLVTWIATKAVLFFLQEAPILSQPIGKGMSLHRAAKLGMFDDAALVLEEIAPRG